MVILREVAQPVVAGLVVLLTLLVLVGTAIRDPRPHDLPLALVGPEQAVQPVAAGFAAAAPGAFRISAYATEPAARSALDDRRVDGYLVLGPSPRLVVAGAAGDTVTGIVTAAVRGALARQGITPAVETVHPFAGGDPHGVILFFVVVAVLVSSLLAAAAGARTAGGPAVRAAAVAVYAILGAAAAAGVAVWLTGSYGGSYWQLAGLLALAALGIGAVSAGLERLLGTLGIALSGVVVVLLGLVASGGPVGTEVLPDFYRAVAPWFPAGALEAALRSALFFGGRGAGTSVPVLAGWAVGGAALLIVADLVRRGRTEARAA